MNPVYLRKFHIAAGIILAVSILIQAGTGLLLSLRFIPLPNGFRLIHWGGGMPGMIYRGLLGCGLLFMVVSGAVVFFKTRKMMKK